MSEKYKHQNTDPEWIEREIMYQSDAVWYRTAVFYPEVWRKNMRNLAIAIKENKPFTPSMK